MSQPLKLYTFGPYFGLPDGSPFVLKTLTLLKMSGVPFVEDRGGLAKAPLGKLPYIDDGGTIVADSTMIRRHLETVHGIDFEAGLTPEQAATGWALERMLEDNVYWLVLYERWVEDANFERGPKRFFDGIPNPVRPIVSTLVRRKLKRSLHLHGIGRHCEADRLALAKGDFAAMATLLGDKPFLFGDTPHGADATLFAFAAAITRTDLQPKLSAMMAPHANLKAYVERMMGRYFPDFHDGLKSGVAVRRRRSRKCRRPAPRGRDGVGRRRPAGLPSEADRDSFSLRSTTTRRFRRLGSWCFRMAGLVPAVRLSKDGCVIRVLAGTRPGQGERAWSRAP